MADLRFLSAKTKYKLFKRVFYNNFTVSKSERSLRSHSVSSLGLFMGRLQWFNYLHGKKQLKQLILVGMGDQQTRYTVY